MIVVALLAWLDWYRTRSHTLYTHPYITPHALSITHTRYTHMHVHTGATQELSDLEAPVQHIALWLGSSWYVMYMCIVYVCMMSMCVRGCMGQGLPCQVSFLFPPTRFSGGPPASRLPPAGMVEIGAAGFGNLSDTQRARYIYIYVYLHML